MSSKRKIVDDEEEEFEDTKADAKEIAEARHGRTCVGKDHVVKALLEKEKREQSMKAKWKAQLGCLFPEGVIPSTLQGCDFTQYSPKEAQALIQSMTPAARAAYHTLFRVARSEALLHKEEDMLEEKFGDDAFAALQNLATGSAEQTPAEQEQETLTYERAARFIEEFCDEFYSRMIKHKAFCNKAFVQQTERDWAELVLIAQHFITGAEFEEKKGTHRVVFTCTRDNSKETAEREAMWRLHFEAKGVVDMEQLWTSSKGEPEPADYTPAKLKDIQAACESLVVKGDVKRWRDEIGGSDKIDKMIALIICYGVLALDMSDSLVLPKAPTASGGGKRRKQEDVDDEPDESDDDFIADSNEEEENEDEEDEAEDDEVQEIVPEKEQPPSKPAAEETKSGGAFVSIDLDDE